MAVPRETNLTGGTKLLRAAVGGSAFAVTLFLSAAVAFGKSPAEVSRVWFWLPIGIVFVTSWAYATGAFSGERVGRQPNLRRLGLFAFGSSGVIFIGLVVSFAISRGKFGELAVAEVLTELVLAPLCFSFIFLPLTVPATMFAAFLVAWFFDARRGSGRRGRRDGRSDDGNPFDE